MLMTLAGFELLALGGGFGLYFGLGGYFEWRYYLRRRQQAAAWKIQPQRFTAPRRRRAEVFLSVVNLAGASLMSGYLAYRISTDNPTAVYTSSAGRSLAFSLAATG